MGCTKRYEVNCSRFQPHFIHFISLEELKVFLRKRNTALPAVSWGTVKGC